MINLGNLKIKGLYIGSDKVKKAYLGTVQVYPNASLALSVTSLAFAASGGTLQLTLTVEEGQPWNIVVPSPWVASATSGTGSATLTLTIDNNRSTSARSGVLTVTSEDLTATCNLTQAAGRQIYGEISIGTFGYTVIPAKGGTVSPKLAYSQPWTWNGVDGSGGTITSGATVAYSGSGVNTTSGAVSATSKTTQISGQTTVTTATVSVSLNGKSAAKEATVYQQANTFSDNSMKLHFGSFTGANTITVGAGSSSTAVYLEVTRLYTSGVYQSGYNVTTGGTFTVSGTGFSIRGSNVIAASRGTTAGAARSGTVTGKYSHLTATGTITQQENKVTNSNYNPRITAYGTPSVSIGSGITAAGGRATVTHSVTNTQTYNALYASGATGPDQTRSVAGTTTIAITANGNSRFKLSGNTITHTTMGTSVTTDTVTVTATNAGSTTKTSTASKSIANAVTGYTGVKINTFTYSQIPSSGGTCSPTLDIQYDTTYTSGSTLTTHAIPPGHTNTFSIIGPFSINSTTGAVTATSNSGASRSATVSTIIKNGSQQIAAKFATVTQAAYVQPTKSLISLSLSYNSSAGAITIRASAPVKETLSIQITYTDGNGAGYDDRSQLMSAGSETYQGYGGGPSYPYAGILSVNNEISGRLETANAIYTWDTGLTTMRAARRVIARLGDDKPETENMETTDN